MKSNWEEKMIVYMKPGATEEEIGRVTARIEQFGNRHDVSRGDQVMIGIKGPTQKIDEGYFAELPGVERVFRISKKWKEVSREYHQRNTVIDVNGVKIGEGLVVIAGPCTVESREQTSETARMVKAYGANMLRGGAWKPRTSTYEFQGLGEEGLEYLALAKEVTGLPIVTEIMGAEMIPLFEKYGVDIYQVGARSCQNFQLLKELSGINKPVLLKRGLAVTIDEYLCAAEYLHAGNGSNSGNKNVILCERGIRTFETATRNTADVNAIAWIKRYSHLPIIGDPSHATGLRELVPDISRAMVAAGADGLIIEAHFAPENALVDGQQSVRDELEGIIKKCKEIYELVHK